MPTVGMGRAGSTGRRNTRHQGAGDPNRIRRHRVGRHGAYPIEWGAHQATCTIVVARRGSDRRCRIALGACGTPRRSSQAHAVGPELHFPWRILFAQARAPARSSKIRTSSDRAKPKEMSANSGPSGRVMPSGGLGGTQPLITLAANDPEWPKPTLGLGGVTALP